MADKIGINILNREYYVTTTNHDPLYLSALARFVENKMKEAGEKNNIVDTSRLAVHAALNIAEELFKIKNKENNKDPEMYDERIDSLIKNIDGVLSLD